MLETRIEEWIEAHREQLLADIGKLVAIPSVAVESAEPKVYGETCAEALETMLALGEQYGFRTFNADYRCAVIEGGLETGKSVGIWGHVDVVPAGEHWIYPPFESTRKGDFLIGRGVQDNKGPTIAVLYALRCIKELQIPLRYKVKQIIGCSEEAGMGDALYFVEHHDVPDFNIVADSGFPVCYGEKGIIEAELASADWKSGSSALVDFRAGSASNIVPGDAEIILRWNETLAGKLAHLPDSIVTTRTTVNGIEAVKLAATGISGHAAFPSGSVNAINLLLDAVLAAELLDGADESAFQFIRSICATNDGAALGIACADELSGELTCVGAVGRLEADEVRLAINIRYPITVDAQALVTTMRDAAEAGGFKLASIHINEANRGNKEAAEVRLLNDTFNRVMGTQAEPFVMGGGTYARKIPNAVAFGPGLPADISVLGMPAGHGQIHGPDEAQSIPNLLTALKIYVMALIALNEAM
ncbi:Sapep family Mn(2+)-dependent dipeptidase [Paenibacillus radicis (ex Gao et al. 2016)]|uniref:Peptidase M20 n=1 Tax=Paenibacillus radicis (ex Gao et al. 2016) TaxID=1737354 RepID=A0A917H1H9_9BACL|nr:Sapep family Mn(2+)-dependent dipeptidase [Paenibacillus radicis (ex Gao et al. 2016)]GGG64217.1 peptidase M20 [Paenibacillus radicis (ex Gao et al. 2016)]